MSKDKKTTIEVKGAAITVLSLKEDDYICITDIARYKNAECTDDLVRNWPRNRNTIEFPGIWEQLDNPDFKPVEFDGIRMQAGLMQDPLTCGIDEHGKLRSLKTALMQDLLTGKKRVTDLLNDTEVTSV
jgi:hypothetical protein